jgi:hypothetical protein
VSFAGFGWEVLWSIFVKLSLNALRGVHGWMVGGSIYIVTSSSSRLCTLLLQRLSIGPSSDFLKILANNMKPIGVYGCDWNPIDNSFTSLKHCFYSINLKDRDTGMGTDDAHPYEKAYTSSLRTHH